MSRQDHANAGTGSGRPQEGPGKMLLAGRCSIIARHLPEGARIGTQFLTCFDGTG